MSTVAYEHNVADFEDRNASDGDNRLFVVFYKDAVHNEGKSTEAGRPIYDDVDLIKIMTPGSKDSMVSVVDNSHKYRFPKQWAQYQQNAEQIGSGTPLAEVPWLTAGQRAEFKAINVRTVEQLVGMADSQAQRFMGFHAIKQRAQSYLDLAAGNAPAERLNAIISKQEAEMQVLRDEMEQMRAIMKAQVSAKAPPKG